MKIEELLTETLSRIAYHYTNFSAALNILKTGQFELSSALGSVEQQYMPKGKPYFLSTTRTKLGGYHHKPSIDRGVIFVLDGDWFNRNYRSQSVDYWGSRGTDAYGRTSEAEDRVFSADPTIPIGGVTAVHILLKGYESDSENDTNMRAIARELLISAKTQNIPAYFYTDGKSWLQLDTKNTSDISKLTGRRKPSYYRGSRFASKYMKPWLELMQAQSLDQLSKEADRIRYSLNYTYDLQSAKQGLAVDMSNARQPGSLGREVLVKIIKFMRQNKLNTVDELVDFIANKWKNIKAAKLIT